MNNLMREEVAVDAKVSATDRTLVPGAQRLVSLRRLGK